MFVEAQKVAYFWIPLFDLSIYEQGPNLPNPVDGSGKFTAEVTDFQGRYVKDADLDIIAAVKVGISLFLLWVTLVCKFVDFSMIWGGCVFVCDRLTGNL